MKNFAVRFDASGIILRTGTCPDNAVSKQAGIGETAFEVAATVSDTTHYYLGDELIEGAVPQPTISVMTQLRRNRTNLLARTDWTQAADSPLTVEKKAEYVTYRRALRDMPVTNADITSIEQATWPTAPS